MRSLFLKIFLWFWLAMVLVGAAVVITWTLQSENVMSRWRAATSEALSLYSETAAEEFERYGPANLTSYLQRLHKATGIDAALLDENGTPIAGSLPSDAKSLLARTAESGQPEFMILRNRAMAALRTVGPSGKTYHFVAVMRRGPFVVRLPFRTQMLRLALAILITGIICYILTRYLTRPVLQLRTAARLIAAGDLGARANPKLERRHDELGELVRAFNLMAERIEVLVNSERQLISDISHELRSPLARLNVALGLVRQRAPAEAAPALDRIEREAERLNELIGRLLTLARMQAASVLPEKTQIELRDLLAEIAADAEFEAQERGCHVQLQEDCGDKSSAVLGSAELLSSALENVVRNAIRYTAPGTAVEIRLACSNGSASISVRDHGPGVPESELENMFRPFYRLANARERQTGGVGLGLAISKRAVRLHGGSIIATNAEGGGLRVEVKLPLSQEVSH